MKSFPKQLIHSYSCLFYFGFPSNLATGSMKKNTQGKFFSLPTLTTFSNPGFHVRLGTPDDNWVSGICSWARCQSITGESQGLKSLSPSFSQEERHSINLWYEKNSILFFFSFRCVPSFMTLSLTSDNGWRFTKRWPENGRTSTDV